MRTFGHEHADVETLTGEDSEAVKKIMCLHFKNSNLHKNDKREPQHQAMVKKAAGL